jgi:hypothetical protein
VAGGRCIPVLKHRSFLLVLAASLAATVALVPVILSRDSSERLTVSEYRSELREALGGFKLTEVNSEEALGELAGNFRSSADRLADVEPPADAAGAHGRLISGLRDYAARLEGLSGAGGDGAAKLQQELAENQAAGEDLLEAFNELAAKDYLSSPGP